MPSERFIKLFEDKQQKFIQVALEEFGNNSYASASISQIAKNLQIAKTNVYHYFENKKDLYFYLLESIKASRLELVNRCVHYAFGYLLMVSGSFFYVLHAELT